MWAHKAAKLVQFDLALRFSGSNDIMVSDVKQIFYRGLDLCEAEIVLSANLDLNWLMCAFNPPFAWIRAAVKRTSACSGGDL